MYIIPWKPLSWTARQPGKWTGFLGFITELPVSHSFINSSWHLCCRGTGVDRWRDHHLVQEARLKSRARDKPETSRRTMCRRNAAFSLKLMNSSRLQTEHAAESVSERAGLLWYLSKSLFNSWFADRWMKGPHKQHGPLRAEVGFYMGEKRLFEVGRNPTAHLKSSVWG